METKYFNRYGNLLMALALFTICFETKYYGNNVLPLTPTEAIMDFTCIIIALWAMTFKVIALTFKK